MSPRGRRLTASIFSSFWIFSSRVRRARAVSSGLCPRITRIDLPGAETSQLSKIEKLVLQVAADGRLIINSEPVTLADLRERIKSVISEAPDVPLFLEADQNVSHGTVVKVMDIAKKSGVKKLTIATKEVVSAGD